MKNNEIIREKSTGHLLKYLLVAGLSFVWLSTINSQVPVTKPAASQQVPTVRLKLNPVKLSATELETAMKAIPSQGTTSERGMYINQPSGSTIINVNSPADQDIWEGGKEYSINWSGANNAVKINLVTTVLRSGGNQTTITPIVNQAPNTGTYRFRVPYNWVKELSGTIKIETIDGKQNGGARGRIYVYTYPVDMECQIVDVNLIRREANYVFYIEKKKWVQFNVLMRNKGTRSPITINQVLVRLIKEPEGIVVYQEDWGFSGIYYHDWYRLPDPRKINISSLEAAPFWKDQNINFESGSYRVEVEIDPQNQLGEIQDFRSDNKDEAHFRIKSQFN